MSAWVLVRAVFLAGGWLPSCAYTLSSDCTYEEFPLFLSYKAMEPIGLGPHPYHLISPCDLISKLRPTLCNPMDCSPPGSSVHGIFQARVLKWVAIFFSRETSRLMDRTWVSCAASNLLHCRRILYQLSHQRSPISP